MPKPNENDEKDEFLRKKEILIQKHQQPTPIPFKRTGTVKITISSLSAFKRGCVKTYIKEDVITI